MEGWFAQVRTVTQATLDAAQMNANSAQQLLSAQATAQQNGHEDRGLQGRDLARVLKQPSVFNPNAREEELSMWKSWSWELEQYLGALDHGFTEELVAHRRPQATHLLLLDSHALQPKAKQSKGQSQTTHANCKATIAPLPCESFGPKRLQSDPRETQPKMSTTVQLVR